MFLFICFFCVIFSTSFVIGIIAFFYDIKKFNVDKKRTKIIASAEEEVETIGTDTGDIPDVAELE